MHAKLQTLALLAGGLLAASQASAQIPRSYTFTDLGTLAGRSNWATAVSNTGKVVGIDTRISSIAYRATVWHGSTPTELQTLGGRSGASDINTRGQIVGWDALGADRPHAQPLPTLWGGAKLIPLAMPGDRGFAYAINDRGEVAGEVDLPTGGTRAVVWKGTKLTVLDTLGGADDSAKAINNRGQVVGTSSLPGMHHAVLWNGKAATDLGTLGGHYSDANAINDRSQVVGASTLSPSDDDVYHATIWNGTHATDLGTLAGGYSFASSINNAGLVVGRSEFDSPTSLGSHATLWTGGTAIDLNSLLDAKTVSEGWVLTEANDINDKGWIVGSASNSLLGITTHAFLLTPLHQGSTPMAAPMMLTVPEPETYAMLLADLGLIAGTLLRRRKVT